MTRTYWQRMKAYLSGEGMRTSTRELSSALDNRPSSGLEWLPIAVGPGGPVNAPEPATYALLLVGMAGLLVLRRYRMGAEDARG